MKHLVFASIPGLRQSDLASMPNTQRLFASGNSSRIEHSFPAVTWPSQATMLTGKSPQEHGIIGNGFFWREKAKVEMWTAWNEVIEQPQIWDTLKQHGISSAAWFPMLSKGCGADYVCMPAPIHQPDGSEDLWCYTKPQDFYGQLLEKLGHFPLKHFWGPLANIKSSDWIVKSATLAAAEFKPNLFYIYLPHLDYAAQKFGPDSQQAIEALAELDNTVGEMVTGFEAALGVAQGAALGSSNGDQRSIDWMFASEYVITSVDHVSYPNRELRSLGLLEVLSENDGEHLDVSGSKAWALVDHQFSHVFAKDRSPDTIEQIVKHFEGVDGIERVLTGSERGRLDHERSGDVVLVSSPNSWQAYYWWQSDERAPAFAHTVDIHRKPGYDPVELHFDISTMSVPLDATLIKGSHGYAWENAPAGAGDHHRGVLLTTAGISDVADMDTVTDVSMYQRVLEYFGVESSN